MFKGPVYKAILEAIKERVTAAEEKHQQNIDKAQKRYQDTIEAAATVREQSEAASLEEAVNSVIR